jgi:hypothetical protein
MSRSSTGGVVRKEFPHPSKPLAIAFGVDNFLKPGTPGPHTFVQIWDTSEFDQPCCNDGEGGFSNIIANVIGLDFDAAHELSCQYGFMVLEEEIFEIFD